MHRTLPHLARRQRGISLLEALLAFVVLSFGMLALGKLQSHLRLQADIARQQSQAVRLAQQDIERLRAYSVLTGGGGVPAYADIDTASATVDEGCLLYTSDAADE